MITTILGLAGAVSGILGAAGTVFKLLGRFAPGLASSVLSNPIADFFAKLSVPFVDLAIWVVKGILGYAGAWLAGGLDHISKDARAFAILMAVAWGAYQMGGIGRPDPISPPAATSGAGTAVPKPNPNRTSQRSLGLPWPFDVLF